MALVYLVNLRGLKPLPLLLRLPQQPHQLRTPALRSQLHPHRLQHLDLLQAGQPGTSAATSQPTTQAPTTGSSTGTGTANANLGASTSGPAPTAQSRLKNKSMDEIITRWASDLSKYQKEFQKQAERVAAWDRMLVENSEKIQKLYGSTLEAERATTEVERQLTAVENDQDELEMWLNYYEKEVDKLTSDQVGYGESLQGPDQERERT